MTVFIILPLPHHVCLCLHAPKQSTFILPSCPEFEGGHSVAFRAHRLFVCVSDIYCSLQNTKNKALSETLCVNRDCRASTSITVSPSSCLIRLHWNPRGNIWGGGGWNFSQLSVGKRHPTGNYSHRWTRQVFELGEGAWTPKWRFSQIEGENTSFTREGPAQ